MVQFMALSCYHSSRMRFRCQLLFIILLVIFLFTSCQKEKDDVLRIGFSQEPPVLDVMVNSSLSGRIIAVGNIYEKLLVLDSSGEIRPELCASYELSEDGKSLTFTLRKGVMFHNGREMTAEDAALSMNRWLEKYGQAGNVVKDARFTFSGNEITIRGTESLALLPLMIASSPQSAVIMPAETLDPVLVTEIIGTGPYMLSGWQPGNRIELEAFPEYKAYADGENDGLWGDKTPSVSKLAYIFVPDSVTRRLGLESGQYDFIDCVVSDDIPAFCENDGISLLYGDESGSIVLVFNKKEGLSADIDIRSWIAGAVDREDAMRACYGDYGYTLSEEYMESWQTTWLTGYEGKYPSALPESYDGSAFRILTSGMTDLDKIAIAVSSSLEEKGMNTSVEVLDWASFMEKRSDSSSYDCFVSAFSSVPLPTMKSYFLPAYAGGFADEESLSLLGNVSGAGSIEAARNAWVLAEERIREYVPAVVLGHYATVYALSSGLSGVILQDGFYFWNAEMP